MKKPLFDKAVIAGVGLMGGSLGLALKRKHLARHVVGLVRRQQTIRDAKQMGSIDSGTLSAPEAVQGADLVVLGCPVSQIPVLLQAMLPHLPENCLVTDMGSTKQVMLGRVKRLAARYPGLNFAASHPMAGSEKAGVMVARPDLYQDVHCLLIREPWTHPAALRRLEILWRAVGCNRISLISAAEHDAWTAAVSHLPHATAVCLANTVADLCAAEPRMRAVAATGFRDTTRIAAGLPAMWADILMTNRSQVGKGIKRLQDRLTRVQRMLRKGDVSALEAELARAREFRLGMEPQRPRKFKGESA